MLKAVHMSLSFYDGSCMHVIFWFRFTAYKTSLYASKIIRHFNLDENLLQPKCTQFFIQTPYIAYFVLVIQFYVGTGLKI